MPAGQLDPSAFHVLASNSVVVWLSLAMLIFFALGAYGWGRALACFLRAPLFRVHSFCVVAGLAVLNILGGWLNLLKLATTPALFALLAGGALFALVDLWRRKPWAATVGRQRPSLVILLPLLIALVFTIGAAAFLIRPLAFNHYDDFITYLPRVLRMVQTGTLAGNPLETLGTDSLGGQAFFQGFFLPVRDVRILHVFDAVACLGLALFLVAELAVRWRLPVSVGATAVLLLAVLNPQCVNVSSVYSGVVAGLALVVTGAALAARLSGARPARPLELLLAALAALLVTLKVTSAFFAAFYLSLLFLGLLVAGGPWRLVLKSALTVLIATTLFTGPWLMLHLPTYALAQAAAEPFTVQATLAARYPSLTAHAIPQLLSSTKLFWGDSILSFNILVLLGLAAGAVALVAARGQAGRRKRALVSVAAVGLAALTVYLLNAHLFSVDNAIRYSCATLITTVVTAGLLLPKWTRAGVGAARRHRRIVIGTALFLAGAILLFGASFLRRIRTARESRVLIAYPLDEEFRRYCAWMLSERPASYYQSVQAKIEPGATVLAWMTTPFHLDFSRHRFLTLSEAALLNPAVRFPAGIGPEELRAYLKRLGVRYVWQQLPGPGVRTVESWKQDLRAVDVVYRQLAEYAVYFHETLAPLLAQSKTVHRDDVSVLVDLGEPVSQETVRRIGTQLR